MSGWYYARTGISGEQEAVGPYDDEAITSMLTNGELFHHSLLYHHQFAPYWDRLDTTFLPNELVIQPPPDATQRGPLKRPT